MTYITKDTPLRTFKYSFQRARQEKLSSHTVSDRHYALHLNTSFHFAKGCKLRSLTIARRSIPNLSKREASSLLSCSLHVCSKRHKYTSNTFLSDQQENLAFFMELRLVTPRSTVIELHCYLERNTRVEHRCFGGKKQIKILAW